MGGLQVKNFEQEHGSTTSSFLNKVSLVPSLNDFVRSKKIQEISNFIFEGHALHHMNLLQVSAGGKKQGIAWHRDTAFKFGAMQMMNLLFYPYGTDKRKGGITILPGSQKQQKANIPNSFGEADGQLTLFPKKRDLLIVDGTCFHCVSHSTSTEDRLSFNVRIRHDTADKEVTRYAEFTTGIADFLPEEKKAESTETMVL